jgi:hypothetical protein
LETASQRLGDGAATEILDAVDCEGTLQGAHTEVEWIKQHNAAWIDKASKLNLREVEALTTQAEAATADLQRCAPPGILPPGIEQVLSQTVQNFRLLKDQLAEQSSVVEALQEDSVVIGRRVRALQTELKTHKALIRERMLQGLTTQIRPVVDADARLADALRKQRGLEDKARKDAGDFLEDFSSAVKRASSSTSSAPADAGNSMAAARDSCAEAQKGTKEVRAAVSTLRGALTSIHRELQGKLGVVLDAIAGEPEPSPGNASRGREEASEVAEGKEKRNKKGKKKGKAQAVTSGDSSQQRPPTSVEEAPNAASAIESAATPKGVAASDPQPAPADGDAELREEFAREFAGEQSPEPEKTVSGKDLLKQMKELNSASNAMEERIAARMAKKAAPEAEAVDGEVAPKETHQSQKNTLRKKKVLYA